MHLTMNIDRAIRLIITIIIASLLVLNSLASSLDVNSFGNPEQVTIANYNGDAMEPFITRDGRFLLFNNLNDPSVDTNLHYAERVADTIFIYKGEIEGANTTALEGVASTDRDNRIYFISPRDYPQTFSTIYQGFFINGKITDVKLVRGISKKRPGRVNFDAEISPDGNTLYFVDSRFGRNGPETADLVIAERRGKGFRRVVDSAKILHNINSEQLEYAPAISADGRELFFTRFALGSNSPEIYVAIRADAGAPFGKPIKLTAISGFVEAPTLSPDEKSLYYHKREGSRFVIYRVTRS
ncbi:MAG: hypothetical protein AB1489_25370 [Acidobacteriota bacterium]